MDLVPTRPRFLFAGDSTDIPLLRTLFTRLPVDAYGQIFVEVASRVQIQRFEMPEAMNLTWLVRDSEHTGRGMAPRGALIVEAVRAWFSEWMSEEAAQEPSVIWIGCATSPRVSRLHDELHERYQLHPGSAHH